MTINTGKIISGRTNKIKHKRANKTKQKAYLERGFRSGLELDVANILEATNTSYEYEPDSIPFIEPAKKRKYTPDFKLRENVYIESKGRLRPDDRQKLVWFKEQHPEVTIYLLFGKADNKISPSSKTTYSEWAEKNGFKWGDIKYGVPQEWLQNNNNKD